MTVIFGAVDRAQGFGFVIADDLRGGLTPRDKQLRVSKVAVVDGSFAITGFGLDTAINATSFLDTFPSGIEFRDGTPRYGPATIEALNQESIPAMRRWVELETRNMLESGDKRALPAARKLNASVVILDVKRCRLVLSKYGRIFPWNDNLPQNIECEDCVVYRFGAGDGSSEDGRWRVCSLTAEVVEDPWRWCEQQLADVRARCLPGQIGAIGAGVVVRGNVPRYRTAFDSIADALANLR